MKNKKMKRLFVFVPTIFLLLFLQNSFAIKENREGITESTKAFTCMALCYKSVAVPFSKIAADKVSKNKPGLTNIVFKSVDGGQTWQDISEELPQIEQPIALFSGKSDLYLHQKNVMYSSKSTLKSPVWEKENIPDLRSTAAAPSTSIIFNRSGAVAFNYNGQIYEKKNATKNWTPLYPNFKKHALRSVFETSDGTIFLSYDHGIYKSADKGKNWKQVQDGMVINIVESEGVLIAAGGKGIMRSTDNGDHWEWVISEGGVGIAVERINGGFAAISYDTTTESRRVRISLDKGKTWRIIDKGLNPSPFISSIKQMGKYLICGHPDGILRTSDLGKTWQRVYPGIADNVFRIYVSGNVLYAVSGSAGC
ncbi:MAG: WD40/YVTN/BNR-like repeat-containing protein [Bacteroidia bacterium]